MSEVLGDREDEGTVVYQPSEEEINLYRLTLDGDVYRTPEGYPVTRPDFLSPTTVTAEDTISRARITTQ